MTDATNPSAKTGEPVAWMDPDQIWDVISAIKKSDYIAAGYPVRRYSLPLYTHPQPSLSVGLDRERVELAVLRWQENEASSDVGHSLTLGDVDTLTDAILALAAPAEGYAELEADMERDLTESDQDAIERSLRTILAFDAVGNLRSVLSDTMTRQASGYDWNADPDGMTLRQSEAIKQAEHALPAAPTGETGA